MGRPKKYKSDEEKKAAQAQAKKRRLAKLSDAERKEYNARQAGRDKPLRKRQQGLDFSDRQRVEKRIATMRKLKMRQLGQPRPGRPASPGGAS